VRNFARRKSLEAGCAREKKRGVGAATAGDKQFGSCAVGIGGVCGFNVYSVITSGAAALSLQEKINSAELQQSLVHFTGFICEVVR
jgi:thiamine monophosphate synthase